MPAIRMMAEVMSIAYENGSSSEMVATGRGPAHADDRADEGADEAVGKVLSVRAVPNPMAID